MLGSRQVPGEREANDMMLIPCAFAVTAGLHLLVVLDARRQSRAFRVSVRKSNGTPLCPSELAVMRRVVKEVVAGVELGLSTWPVMVSNYFLYSR
jgi:hypothetical protein